MFTNKEKQCVICWKEIDKKKESYVEIRDYTNGKFQDHCFHHLSCWQNKFQITQNKINEMANDWMNKIQNIALNKMGGTQTFEVK